MKILAFDIETASAAEIHSYGPGFIRLCGWADVMDGPVTISTDPAALVAALEAADAVTAHNGANFDALALAVQGYISLDGYERLVRKMFDTLIVARHLDPVAARGVQANGYYRLGNTAKRYALDGKDTVDFEGKREIVRRIRGDKEADKLKPGKVNSFPVLDLVASLYGGYDQIPQDDYSYNGYLAKDVQVQAALFKVLADKVRREPAASQAYLRREHYVAAAMGRVTLEGFRVDVDLTMKRWSEGQARLDAGKQLMHERYGMPLEGKKPHVTNAGKAAFRAAIIGTGISPEALDANWPLNKDGSLSTGKEVLNGMITLFERTKPEAAELCRVVLAMNGERTVAGTILNHTVSGRVHPYIGPDQASGRWSMKEPGLTVLGKRGGKAAERAMLLADEDDVLVAIDADQVDARVIAAECQDPEYMKLFEPGMDLHSEVAFRVWPDMAMHGPDCHQLDEFHEHSCGIKNKCHCELRDRAKVFGHGFSYGLGANGMARQHGVDVAVAQEFIHGMTQAFPRLAAWKDETRAAAGALGFDEEAPEGDTYRILHTWAGRPMRVERNRAYTQATAQVGQGGTRDVMAQAVLNLPPFYRRRIRAVIHDELVLSLPRAGAQEAAQSIADGMGFDLRGVKITFGVSRVGDCWAAAYGEQYCPH